MSNPNQRFEPAACRHDATLCRLAAVAAGIGTWERDLATGWMRWDDYLYSVYGLEAQRGRPVSIERWKDAIHAEDRARVLLATHRAIEERSRGEAEFRIVCADGEVRRVLSTFLVECDVHGEPVRVLGADFDVTRLRSAEHEAMAYAEQLRLAGDAVGVGIYECAAGGGEARWSEQALRLLGLQNTTAAVGLEQRLAVVHEADRDRVRAALRAALQDGGAYDLEYRVVWHDRSIHTIGDRGIVRKDAAGRIASIVGVLFDMTARREAEAEARDAAEKLGLIAASAGIGVWARDLATGAVLWDAQSFRVFGFTPADGDPQALFHRAVHPEDRGRLERARSEAVRRRVPLETEFRIVRPDGEIRHLAVRGVPRYAADGTPLRVVGVNWDITDRHRAAEAIRAKETAERANRAKSLFLARMSHELRAPLNAIIGFAQLLELDPDAQLTGLQRERVEQILGAGHQILQFTNDVLDLARIEAGASEVNVEVVELDAALGAAIDAVQATAARRQVAVMQAWELPPHVAVWADQARLRQVFANVLGAAIQQAGAGSRIRVGVRDDEGGIFVAVEVPGVALSEAQLAKLFEPFERFGAEDAAADDNGLSLSIALRLAEQMGGQLDAASAAGTTAFRIRLRGAGVRAPARAERAAAAGLAARTDIEGSVLYIEDNAANSALIAQLLLWRPGVRLYRASDGETGVALAQACDPDLVLIDMRLPDMDGLEVLRRLRAQRAQADTRYVAVSASAMADDIERARAAGLTEYWTKPFDPSALLDSIDAHLLGARRRAVEQRLPPEDCR